MLLNECDGGGRPKRTDLAEELSEPQAPAIRDRLETAVDPFGGEAPTRRERQIERLLLRGHSVASIANALDLAPARRRPLARKRPVDGYLESGPEDDGGAERGCEGRPRRVRGALAA
jgi:hypothetical protein